MNERDILVNNAWKWKCGLPEDDYRELMVEKINLDELRKSEWSEEFENLQRNRLQMGAFRYGKMAKTQEELAKKQPYLRVDSIRKRLDLYEKTGNKEYLVDISNLSMLEFVECHHPNAHFESIDDGIHAKKAEQKQIDLNYD